MGGCCDKPEQGAPGRGTAGAIGRPQAGGSAAGGGAQAGGGGAPAAKPLQEWTCPNPWCLSRMPLKDMRAHRDECDTHRPMRCFKCGEQVEEAALRGHDAVCNPVACPDCGEVVLKRLLKYCPQKCCDISNSLLGGHLLQKPAIRDDPERRQRLAARVLQRAWRAASSENVPSPKSPAAGGERWVGRVESVLMRWRAATRRRWTSCIFRLCWFFLDRWDERGLFTPRRSALFKAPLPAPAGPRKRVSQHFKRSGSLMGARMDSDVDDLLQYPTGGYAALAEGPAQARDDHVAAVREALMYSKLRGAYVASLVDEAIKHLRRQPNVQSVRLPSFAGMAAGGLSTPQSGKGIIVGDLHGQLQDLNRLLGDNGLPTTSKIYIFNGDLVDRGPNSCEVLFQVLCLLLAFPNSVFVNRGNHECLLCTMHYGFREECTRKYSAVLFSRCLELFQALPLATLLCAPAGSSFGDGRGARSVLVVHGGLPRHPWPIDKIDTIDRMREVPEDPQSAADEVMVDLLWSDPEDDIYAGSPPGQFLTGYANGGPSGDGWRFNEQRQAGIFWTAEMTKRYCDDNGLCAVVRSHAPPFAGWSRTHDGLVWTIFSASNYTGVDSNDGGVLVVTPGEVGLNIVAQTWKIYDVLHEATVPDSPKSDSPKGADGVMSPFIIGPRSTSGGASGLRHALTSWTKSAQEDVLRQLRERIFEFRHLLMAQFCSTDTTEKGGVWKGEWVQAMAGLFEGWDALPWFFLRGYLAAVDGVGASGRVRFADFLHRHAVQLEHRLFLQWLPHLVPWLLARAKVAMPGVEWVEIFKPTSGESLSYTEFFDLITNDLGAALHKDVVFLLYGAFDENRDGHCRKEEWMALIERHRDNGYIAGEQAWEDGAWQPLEERRHTMWDLWLLKRLRQYSARLPTPLAAFRTIDLDGDGEIGAADLRKCIHDMGLTGISTDMHQREPSPAGRDLTFQKRVRYVLGKGEGPETVSRLFGVAERDVLIAGGECIVQTWPPNTEQIDSFLRSMDWNGDGRVTFDDFCKAVTVQDREQELIPPP